MIYNCCNETRKSAVLNDPALNGIDFLEVLDNDAIPLGSPRQRTLLIHCLKAVSASLTTSNVLITGGESITSITADWVAPASTPPLSQTNLKERNSFTALPDAASVLVVRTDKAGDFASYELRLVNDASHAGQDPFKVTEVLAGFDPQLATVQFSFKVECGPDFDCGPQLPNCSADLPTTPPINYLAKDFGSFRTVVLDRLSQLLRGWKGTTEADLGVALAEIVAYVGDHFSYQQDAIATEAYLATARSRVSLRRHALLVDYRVHDGCNARTWIQLQVAGNAGDAVFLDHSLTRFYTFAPGMPSNLAVGSGNEEAAFVKGVQVFQPMFDAVLYPAHNQISFYTWSATDCCLPRGSTEATLRGSFPNLLPGDVLIFQEMKGPETGDPADADIRHRCAVRLTQVTTQAAGGKPLVDPLFEDGTGNPIVSPAQKPALVTEIQWAQADAIPFPVCISSTYLDSNGDEQTVTDVSVAFGNVVLADHGLSFSGASLGTVPAPQLFFPQDPASDRCQVSPPAALPVRFRPQVPDSPLTQAVPLSIVSLPAAGTPVTPGVIPLGGTGFVTLTDSSGFACMTLQATNPAGWPSSFGVVVAANSVNPANVDVSVVYNPPLGAAGIGTQVTLELFKNLSFNTADPRYVATQINTNSKLIQIPPTYVPPAAASASFPAAPAMLPNSGTLVLQDMSSPAVSYLTVQAANPSQWSFYFGVSVQPGGIPDKFDLNVVFAPQSPGIGVTLPVTVEEFKALTLSTASGVIDAASFLIRVGGFARTAASSLSAYDLMHFDPSKAVPVITLEGTSDARTETWKPAQDLLESGESDLVFVVEVESEGTATLRFGDDINGKRPDAGFRFIANYRIGNGTAGNVGSDCLVFLAVADARIQSCRNPLPASGGVDPETNDQIRRRAPQAFLTQQRAVTMADYEALTDENPLVDRSVATMRWTGSWYTVFIAVEPQGAGQLTSSLASSLKTNLERYRLAGQDLELDSPQYVSLQIELAVCVDPNYFRSDVQRSLLQVLGHQILPNGQKGLFFPDNFTFGQTVYLSRVYAAARRVAGVNSVRVTKFQPQGVDTSVYLVSGEIKLGHLQVARLENDRNFPDHGQLTLLMEGGK
jgi:hypothetical protein